MYKEEQKYQNLYEIPEVQKSRWKIFFSVMLFNFMATMDGGIINIALPVIAKDLNIDMNKSIWIVAVYMIILCTFLILFGKAGDSIGKIKIFRIGIGIFITGSFLAGFSNSLLMLISARVIQAFGASMTMATNFGIIVEVFSLKDRAKVIGFVSSIASLGTIIGPSVGGIMVEYLPWSYIFWINVPFGLFAMYLGVKYLPKDIIKSKSKMDFMGFCIYALFIVSFFTAAFAGQEIGFGKPIVLLLFSAAIISIIAFIKYELKKKSPLIEFALFKIKSVGIGLFCAFAVVASNYFFNILMPFYLQNAREYSASRTGLILMILPIMMVVCAPISGVLVGKISASKITTIGILILALAHVMLIFISVDTNMLFFPIAAALVGLGSALFFPSNNTSVISSVDKNHLGMMGSLNSLAKNMGNISGIALATTILFMAMSIKSGLHVRTFAKGEEELFVFGMRAAFIVSFLLLTIATILSYKQVKSNKNAKTK
ncbi:MAG: MFS transporter [Campylobacteraceae bacterium]|jgi:EmrB/QacA subfamily drug resistance transporter|nr:MFS transporter [Campylobacteraceae bacterium]